MNDFDRTLDDCLAQMESGASSLDECLGRHPEHAARLRPLLQTAARVERGREVRPSPAFKSRTRAQLYAHMDAHPRRRAWTFSPLWRVAVSLAVMLMALLVTGTAFAQGALPGQPLYAWKLSSEQAWRAVSPDPVGVDLSLAERRTDEAIAVAADPAREAQALNGYLEVLARLQSQDEAGNEARILLALKLQQEKLSAAGISVPDLDHFTPPVFPTPTPSPEIVPSVSPIAPIPSPLPELVPSLPPVVPLPSALPKIVPTLPPDILPTVPVPILNP